MPAPTYKGTFPVILSESTRFFDRGKIEYTIVRAYTSSTVTTGLIGSSTPISGKTLSLTSVSVNVKNGIAEVTNTFSGGDSTAPEVYEVVASVQEEPISSHPAFTVTTAPFASSIVDAAGSANVIFDNDNLFVAFSKTAANRFFGVRSYLSPQVQYRRIFSQGSPPSAGYTQSVSTVYSAPDGQPPTIASGRNWLKVSIGTKNNGNQRTNTGQYEIVEEYRASGQKGWNQYIYFTSN